MEAVRLDLRGLRCPLPVLRTRKALRGLAPGTVLIVECTDPLAGIDIPHMLRESGDELLGTAKGEGEGEGGITFTIRTAGPSHPPR